MHGAAVRTAVFALTLLLPSALLGADAPSGGGGPMDPVLSTTGWTIGIFVVVMLLLRKLAWGPIVKALDERDERDLGVWPLIEADDQAGAYDIPGRFKVRLEIEAASAWTAATRPSSPAKPSGRSNQCRRAWGEAVSTAAPWPNKAT